MRSPLVLALQSRIDNPVSLSLIILRLAPTSRVYLPDLTYPLLPNPLSPHLHRGLLTPSSSAIATFC